MSGTNFLKKLTVRTVGLTTPQLEEYVEDGNEKPALRVYGQISSKEEGMTDYGPYVKFKGQFEGKNMITGDYYRSTVMIVPDPAEGLLAQVFDNGEGSPVEIAADITAAPNPSSKGGTQFRYGARSLIEIDSASDPLMRMRKAVEDKAPVKALPAGEQKKRAKKS